ncbi:LOW QUALITY PROTEIN: 4-hydroxyphenylacetate 3-monooxygenase [Geomicrobium sp. JCM 19037]|nr:LOW QUALITY PROTEIN: 4-hydroxyphenylacetate 3-monooxygenase [Geomicrobium sp. JCM 19037]
MGMVTANEYMERIAAMNSTVWLDGEKIRGPVTKHPAFTSVIKSKANLYDLVHKPEYRAILQADDGSSNFSWEPMTTRERLAKRRLATQLWQMKMPAYSDVLLNMGIRSQHLLVRKIILRLPVSNYGEAIEQLYENAKRADLTFTHTFVNPKAKKSTSFFSKEEEQPIAAKVVDETDAGIVIEGARCSPLKAELPMKSYCPQDRRITCSLSPFLLTQKDPFRGRSYSKDSLFDEPYSSQFEEGDAIVVFDSVFIPWERVFLYKNEELAKRLFFDTGLESALLFHASNRQIVKTEWILGIANEMVNTLKIGQFQHIQQKVSEIITALEAMRGFVYSSEMQAEINLYGMMVPKAAPLKTAVSYYQNTYGRLVEIIQLIGASNFIATPNEKDFESEIAPLLERFMGGYEASAKDRIRLFRLAKDLTMGDFGSRQTQFERYFYGDPIRLQSGLCLDYNLEPYSSRVRNFLEKLK